MEVHRGMSDNIKVFIVIYLGKSYNEVFNVFESKNDAEKYINDSEIKSVGFGSNFYIIERDLIKK